MYEQIYLATDQPILPAASTDLASAMCLLRTLTDLNLPVQMTLIRKPQRYQPGAVRFQAPYVQNCIELA